MTAITLSGPSEVDINAYRGDTGRFRLTINDANNDPIDITSATWDADIRLKKNDVDIITSFDVTLVDGQTNQVDVSITPENSQLLPKKAYYDVEMTLNGDVVTIVAGMIYATEDVSRV